MGVTPRTRFPQLQRGTLATSFLKFPDLPPEIRAQIWKQAACESRIVRLDLGVDSYPRLLRTCFESRQLCKVVYLKYKGEIDSTNERPFSYRAILPDYIGKCKFKIWFNNGVDILHLTRLTVESRHPTYHTGLYFPLDRTYGESNKKILYAAFKTMKFSGPKLENVKRIMFDYGTKVQRTTEDKFKHWDHLFWLLKQDYGIVPDGFWRDASWTLERLLWHQLEERVSEVKRRVWTEKGGVRLNLAEGRDITHVVDAIFANENALYMDESPGIVERNPAITFMRPKGVQLEGQKLLERPEKWIWALEWSVDEEEGGLTTA